MAVSTYFNEELAAVDPTKSFTFVTDAVGHGPNEYTVAGWTITGGSEHAHTHGAAAALYDLGYRFYAPLRFYRPASLASEGVTIAKRQDYMPILSMFVTYGFDAGDTASETAFLRWKILNALIDDRMGVGHVWSNLYSDNKAWFDARPGYYSNGLFLLDNGAAEAEIVDKLAEHIAASKVNQYGLFSIEPNDSSPVLSEDFYRFANAITAKVRETIPNARAQCYAYGNHNLPPSFEVPYINPYVALGFTSAGLGYHELMRRWGEKATFVGLRGYGDIAAWGGYIPMNDASQRYNYWEVEHPIPLYVERDHAQAMLFETNANFTKNIVSHYYAARMWLTGTADYDSIVDEMVPLVFDNDEAVHDLLMHWGHSAYTVASTLQACTYIEAMQDSEYKTQFQQYMAPILAHINLIDVSRTPKYTPQFYTMAEKPLRWMMGIRGNGAHGFAYCRRFDRWGLPDTHRPDMTWNAVPEKPHWYRNPEVPSAQDYADIKAELVANLQKGTPDAILDQSDLVVVDVMPSGGAGNASTPVSTVAYSREAASFWAQGPGTLILEDCTAAGTRSNTREFELGAGMHFFDIDKGFRVQYETGLLWIDGYYGTDFHYSQWNEGAGVPRQHCWVYAPKIMRGKYNVSSSTRLYLIDSLRAHQIGRADPPFAPNVNPDPRSIEPGVVKLDVNITAKDFYLSNLNRWISLHPRKMLMPRALAKLEFPTISFGRAA